jgi:hypothetical protein
MGANGCSGLLIWRRLLPPNPGGAHFWVVTKARARELEVLRFPKVHYYLDE